MKLPITYQYPDGLRTERLQTQFLRPEDKVQWTSFFESKKATTLFPDFGCTTPAENAEFWINTQLNRYTQGTLGLQSIIELKTGKIIGQAGLLLQEVDGVQELEVGYHIKEAYWGKGYAPEAAKLFIDHAFENQLAESIISIIDTRNDNSICVALKNGLKLEKTTVWKGLNVHIYRIHK